MELDRDKFFALMVRHCAAQQRGDSVLEESLAEELDFLYSLHGKTFEKEWKEACIWIAGCVKEWSTDKDV